MLYIKELFIMLLLCIVIGGNLIDVVYDYHEGASLAHLSVEIVLVLASMVLITVLSLEIWRESRSNRRLKAELASLPKTLTPSQSPALMVARHDFAKVLQAQLEEWNLTDTEKEVSLFLLKGLSFKEIAAVRGTLEKTIRQQASSIYRKAGVSGRHEFSAWFIEDIL
jgi:DNA-binding CsgD family transcriptional regulator